MVFAASAFAAAAALMARSSASTPDPEDHMNCKMIAATQDIYKLLSPINAYRSGKPVFQVNHRNGTLAQEWFYYIKEYGFWTLSRRPHSVPGFDRSSTLKVSNMWFNNYYHCFMAQNIWIRELNNVYTNKFEGRLFAPNLIPNKDKIMSCAPPTDPQMSPGIPNGGNYVHATVSSGAKSRKAINPENAPWGLPHCVSEGLKEFPNAVAFEYRSRGVRGTNRQCFAFVPEDSKPARETISLVGTDDKSYISCSLIRPTTTTSTAGPVSTTWLNADTLLTSDGTPPEFTTPSAAATGGAGSALVAFLVFLAALVAA